MPGNGDSDPLTRNLTIIDYADALAAVIATLELRRPHLVGTSVGALIAAARASTPGADVATLTLVEMPVRTAVAWSRMWPLIETLFSTPTQSLEQVKPRFRNLSDSDFRRWNIDRNKAGGNSVLSVMRAARSRARFIRRQ